MTNLNEKELESINGGGNFSSDLAALARSAGATITAGVGTVVIALTPGVDVMAPAAAVGTGALAYHTASCMTQVERDLLGY